MSVHNDKQLAGMPDEVIEEIFNFLDIGSKKSFSLVCKKFNKIYELPKNLHKINFCVSEERGQICDITRQYRHIVDTGNLIPEASLPKFTHLKSYTIIRYEDGSNIKADYLVGLLPHFRNLSCLELRGIFGSCHFYHNETFAHQLQLIFEERMDFEVVEMKHLNTLKIELQLFLLLNGRFVQFSCTQLDNLEIVDWTWYAKNLDFSPLKTLITSQKHLKVLRLIGKRKRVSQMFDTPFIVRGQLKEFKLMSDEPTESNDSLSGYNSTQQDHLADFLMSQNALENLEVDIDIGALVATSKMQYLMQSRLRMPLVKRKINIWNDWNEHKANKIDFDYFTTDELTEESVPNLVTKHVKICFEDLPQASVVRFVSLNYPDLMSLEILGYTDPFDGMNAVNGLKHLESLTLSLFEFLTPSVIHIPTLKILNISQDLDDFGDTDWDDAYKTNLSSFFKNHDQIEEIDMDIHASAQNKETLDKMESEFNEVVENALMQLTSLRKFRIRVYWIRNCPSDSYNSEDNKLLTKCWAHSSKKLAESIKKYANGGFVLQCGSSEFSSEIMKLTKTFDGAVVETDEDPIRMSENSYN